MDILIENNRIGKIEQAIETPSEAVIIDATAQTVLPGLIDSHVHISSVPGSGFRNDSLQLFEDLQHHHLKAYIACGATTILDTTIPTDEARKINGWLNDGHPGPRLLLLAPTFTTENGYLSDQSVGKLFFTPVSSEQDVKERLNESADLNPHRVKVLMESGFGLGRLAIHSDEIRQAIKTQANQRDLKIYIHSTQEKDHHLALDLEPHALVHGSTVGSKEVIARLRENPVYMITTLSIQDAWTIAFDNERLSDPFYKATIPDIELQTAGDPEAWQNLVISFANMVLPESANDEEIADFLQGGNPSDVLAVWINNLKQLHEEGIPIVLGSDAGNWPVMPQMFHGSTSVREVEPFTLAGLTPLEAIKSSTSIPAEMLYMSEDIGTIEVGKIADIMIVEGNPNIDIKTLERIK